MNKKYTNENIVGILQSIHGNTYNYDKTVYTGYNNKITVTCPEHGDFDIVLAKHLNGQGCPKCRYVKSANSKRRSIEEVISMCNAVHHNEYDYSLIKTYKNTKEKLPIICKKHGVFYQTFDNHVRSKQGCPECGKLKYAEHQRLTTEDFITKAKQVHGDKYDYSMVNYTLSQNEVDIICKQHGKFRQIARNHLFGAGCPLCFKEKSNIEREILEYVCSLVGVDNVVTNDRSVLNGKEIDIYVQSYKIGIEVNGLIWHSEKFETDKNVHLNKLLRCHEQGIRLIHIFEDEWLYKSHIVKSRLKNLFGKTETKVFARNCTIKDVPYYESKSFLDLNHIQGNAVSKIRYGLYYNDELVSLMTFSKPRKNVNSNKTDKTESYELVRFCNKINTVVIGGASKLFKFFIRHHTPQEVISFADRCWSDGGLYEKLGFSLYNTSKPSYSYVINKKRINRYNLRKDVLVSKYGCLKEQTEHEFCLSKNWYRIYDCGCLCYRYIE